MGDLLPPQTRGASPGAGGKPHVGRFEAGAASAQKVGEFRSVEVHVPSMARARIRIQGVPVPG